MARRGQNEGSVFQRRDGRWAGTIHLGYSGGKRIRKTFYGSGRAEVASLLAAAVRDRQLGKKPVSGRETLGSFLKAWLEGTVKISVGKSTYVIYERQARLHIEPTIGRVRLTQLTAGDLDALYARLLEEGLSPSTVHLTHSILHNVLKSAWEQDLVAVNVADKARSPRIPRREHRVLSPQEAVQFLEAAREDDLYALYQLALTSGLRSAELLGLRWRDLDLEGAVLHVNQQVFRLNGEWQFTPPKTGRGRRTVSLTASAVEALREHRKAQTEERLRVKDWADHNLVFPNRGGEPMGRATLHRRSFKPLLKRAGLPSMPFHNLRHSAATLLLVEGIHPRIVQEMLGHSSIAVTMDVYSHVLPSMQRDAAERMDRLLAVNS